MHSVLVSKLFEICDQRKQGILDWASFLQVMIVLTPNSFASTIDSCLNLILEKESRAEGDGPLKQVQYVSFDEIRMMCYLGLT